MFFIDMIKNNRNMVLSTSAVVSTMMMFYYIKKTTTKTNINTIPKKIIDMKRSTMMLLSY